MEALLFNATGAPPSPAPLSDLGRLDWSDGIAQSPSEYAEIAVRLAKHPAPASAAIRAGSPRLFRNAEGVSQLADGLESAYRAPKD